MSRVNRSARATARLLVGAAIEAAGIAALCILLHVWLTGAPLRREAVMAAVLGAGAMVLIAGGVLACVRHILHGEFKPGGASARTHHTDIFSSGGGV